MNDYRKVLDRKDIDAVLIATPDHWHGPMVMEASAAGKDSYCEKPVTHSIEVGLKMIEAARQYKRVVQVGLQQRSWQHFQENAERVQKGMFGTIYQAQCVYIGNYLRPPEEGGDPPPDLDWNLFQGPAERRQYTRSRQRTLEVLLRLLGRHAAGLGRPPDAHRALVSERESAADGERVGPVRALPLPAARSTARLGRLLLGLRQVRHDLLELADGQSAVRRAGQLLHRDASARCRSTGPATGTGRIRRASLPGQTPPPPPFAPVDESFRYVGGPSDQAHVRNFLDCVKSRQRPAVDIEDGFYATLPCLMGVLAIRYGKTYAWTGTEAKAV